MNSKIKTDSTFLSQGLPLILAVVIFVALCLLILVEILILNRFTVTDIIVQLRPTDILIGLTIYLKTSVDFAILIGNLMARYPGWKARVAIETGTAFGNALGTVIILAIWDFFRDIKILLALMIVIAALVLLKLAEEGLEHVTDPENKAAKGLVKIGHQLESYLGKINRVTGQFLKYIIPNVTMKPKAGLSFWGLLVVSFTIPFILGLDDFAGYVPVFNIVNVFGFSVGVLLGHMLLNICLFIAPDKTIKLVKQPVISLLGAIAFIGLAVWGIYEAVHLFIH